MLQPGDAAPSLELTDLDGDVRRLSEAFAAGPSLLVFWKTTCRTCDIAFPYLQRLQDAYPGDGWSLFAVSQDPEDDTRLYVEANGLTLPVLLDGEGWPASRAYDPDATPTLFLVEPGGRIAAVSAGFAKEDLNHLSALVAEHLGAPAKVIAPDDDGNPPFRPG